MISSKFFCGGERVRPILFTLGVVLGGKRW
jgi:hypothetical protein